MQRKIIQFIVVISLLLLYTGSVFADYPRYLNGDPNCIIVAGHMGTGWYLKKNSVQVVSENGPVTELTVEVLTVPNAYDGNVNYSNIKKYSFYYDESTQTSINSGMSPQKVMGYYDRNGTAAFWQRYLHRWYQQFFHLKTQYKKQREYFLFLLCLSKKKR